MDGYHLPPHLTLDLSYISIHLVLSLSCSTHPILFTKLNKKNTRRERERKEKTTVMDDHNS